MGTQENCPMSYVVGTQKNRRDEICCGYSELSDEICCGYSKELSR